MPTDQKTQTTKDLTKLWSSFPEHSELSTLLVDDSTLKAHLQPFSHVCVPEYTAKLRSHDLYTWKWSKSASSNATQQNNSRKPRKSKKLPDSQLVLAAQELQSDDHPLSMVSSSNASHLASPPSTYDEILLALVGMLEVVKHETDVTTWIRGGGLLGSGESIPRPFAGLSTPEPPLQPHMWFDDANTLQAWVGKGRAALDGLGIEAVAGVHD